MEKDAILIFGTAICIFCLASVDQINHKPRLICNFIEEPNDITPLVSASTDKAPAPKVIQFVPCLAHILQKIWESDPVDVPVWISKWDISDAFHRCNLCLSYIRKFTYIIPPFRPTPLYSYV